MLIEEFDYEIVQLIPALPHYWARYTEISPGEGELRDPIVAWALLGKGRKIGMAGVIPVESTYSGQVVALVAGVPGDGYVDLGPAIDVRNYSGVVYDPTYAYKAPENL